MHTKIFPCNLSLTGVDNLWITSFGWYYIISYFCILKLKYMNELNGKRIMLVEMVDDPNPIPSGTMGTIRHVGGGVINVDWDCGRSLGVVEGVDRYRIME